MSKKVERKSIYSIITEILEKKDDHFVEPKIYKKNCGRFFVPRNPKFKNLKI